MRSPPSFQEKNPSNELGYMHEHAYALIAEWTEYGSKEIKSILQGIPGVWEGERNGDLYFTGMMACGKSTSQ